MSILESAGELAHKGLLRGAGASAATHMMGGAGAGAALGAVGSVVGMGPTSDDSFLGGAMHGAMIGAAGGAATRFASNRYGASMAAELAGKGAGVADNTLKVSRFTSDAAKATKFWGEGANGMSVVPRPKPPGEMAPSGSVNPGAAPSANANTATTGVYTPTNPIFRDAAKPRGDIPVSNATMSTARQPTTQAERIEKAKEAAYLTNRKEAIAKNPSEMLRQKSGLGEVLQKRDMQLAMDKEAQLNKDYAALTKTPKNSTVRYGEDGPVYEKKGRRV